MSMPNKWAWAASQLEHHRCPMEAYRIPANQAFEVRYTLRPIAKTK